jgi:hypothetical protein
MSMRVWRYLHVNRHAWARRRAVAMLVTGLVIIATAGPALASQGAVNKARPVATTTSTSSAYLSVVFGRSLYAKGVPSCANPVVPAGMMTIDQSVQALWGMGIHVTAAVVPDRTLDSGTKCFNHDLYSNWPELSTLASTYGLTVISATQSYANLPLLTQAQQFQQTCGSLTSLIAHGYHRAWGMLAYPNNQYTTTIQSQVVQNCFAFGRTYVHPYAKTSTLTNYQSTMAAPWLQVTVDVGGGRCRDTTQSCSTLPINQYASPIKLATLVNVAAGNWTALQFYSFVTGKNLTGFTQWDCTNSDWQKHWTNKFEVYCWNDLVYALSHKPSSVISADPATVAEAWGRIPTPLVSIDSYPSTVSGSAPSFNMIWHSPENGNYSLLVGGTDCLSGTPITNGIGTYSTSPSPVTTTVQTSDLSQGSNTIRVCLTNDPGHVGSSTVSVILSS